MIGTIVNTCTIIVGTIAGSILHRGIKEKYKEALYTALGLASLGIGLNAEKRARFALMPCVYGVCQKSLCAGRPV